MQQVICEPMPLEEQVSSAPDSGTVQVRSITGEQVRPITERLACPITEEQILAFEQELILGEKAPRTREKYLHAVRSFAAFLGDTGPSKERLLAYRDELQKTHRPQTVNGYLTAIHTFLHFLGLDGIRVNQLRVQNCAFIDDARLMTKDEYLRLVDEAWHQDRPRLALLLMTLGITGIRISELQYFTVESVRGGRIYINLKGKNRTILITRDLRKVLLDYADRNAITTGPIFLSNRGNPLNRSNIAHEMKCLCKAAGVDPNKVFPHGFRHLFAREFYAKYPNISSLADLLGHSSIETTRRYIATSASEHERHLESLDLFHLPDAG